MNKLMIYESMRYKYCYCKPKRVDCWDQASSEKMEDKIPSGMLQGSLSCAEELNGIRVYIYIYMAFSEIMLCRIESGSFSSVDIQIVPASFLLLPLTSARLGVGPGGGTHVTTNSSYKPAQIW